MRNICLRCNGAKQEWNPSTRMMENCLVCYGVGAESIATQILCQTSINQRRSTTFTRMASEAVYATSINGTYYCVSGNEVEYDVPMFEALTPDVWDFIALHLVGFSINIKTKHIFSVESLNDISDSAITNVLLGATYDFENVIINPSMVDKLSCKEPLKKMNFLETDLCPESVIYLTADPEIVGSLLTLHQAHGSVKYGMTIMNTNAVAMFQCYK